MGGMVVLMGAMVELMGARVFVTGGVAFLVNVAGTPVLWPARFVRNLRCV